jgi:hypothetical protein
MKDQDKLLEHDAQRFSVEYSHVADEAVDLSMCFGFLLRQTLRTLYVLCNNVSKPPMAENLVLLIVTNF